MWPAGETRPDLTALFAPLAGHARIGAAVSGGPDSVALMLMLADWAKRAGKTVFVYTLDHGLRPEAAAECGFVANLAAQLGLTARILCWRGEKPVGGVQAAARAARYQLIGKAMHADGAEILVTAHHLGDQAETVLMRMAHGSGIGGLAGMGPLGTVEGVHVFRPLLAIDKGRLEALVAAAGITPVTDPSNSDRAYERVRWRGVVPQLANEGLSAARLGQFASRMARADAALKAYGDASFGTLVRVGRFGGLWMNREKLLALPDEITLRILRRAVSWAGAETRVFALQGVEKLAGDLNGASPGFRTTLGGTLIVLGDEDIGIMRETGRIQVGPIVLQPGAEMVWDRRFHIHTDSAISDVRIESAAGLTRRELERFAGEGVAETMDEVGGAPLIRTHDDEVVALGGLAQNASQVKISLTLRTNAIASG